MTASFLPLGPVIVLCFAASLVVASWLMRSARDALRSERAMLAGAAVLAGLAPVVWFFVAWLGGQASPFAGGVQLVVAAAPDERDREITLKSSRYAYYLLFAGFVSLPFCAVFEPSVVSFVITWTATLVLTELVYFGSVLAYYRLGTG